VVVSTIVEIAGRVATADEQAAVVAALNRLADGIGRAVRQIAFVHAYGRAIAPTGADVAFTGRAVVVVIAVVADAGRIPGPRAVIVTSAAHRQ